MALHQYIGARYVPKFYENSAGTAEWRGGVIYEPLTIVTWNGNSYTSKRVVPASVGDPSSNPTYWVATGMFNEQLAEITQEMADFKDEVDEKLSKFVNVVNYGAVGDGVTDDTEAIQAAVDAAEESGSTLFIPDGMYLVSTIWISSNIQILGTGTLKAYPIRYDVTVAPITAGSNTVEVTNGSIYKKNMILTVADGAHTDVMVVTDVIENTLTVRRFRYYDEMSGSDGFGNSYQSAAVIHINTVPLVITAHIYTVSQETDATGFPINNVDIYGLSVQGSKSGFDNTKYSIYDITLNGCVFIYRVKNLTIESGNYGNCYNNAIMILGRNENVTINGNSFDNVQTPAAITEVGLKDVAAAVLMHWDQRYQNQSEVTSDFAIKSNYIKDCYNGIFLSASRRGEVAGNTIDSAEHYGIEVYTGDLGYGVHDIVVHGNVISRVTSADTVGSAIDLRSAIRINVESNTIHSCERGVDVPIGTHCSINNNEIISCTDAAVHIGRMDGKVSNNLITSGAGCRAAVEVDNQSGSDITLLELVGNYYRGYNTSNAAIRIAHGQNVYCMNELSEIRALFQIGEDVAESDNIYAIGCAAVNATGNIALAMGERAKIKSINSYIQYMNLINTDSSVLAKSAEERNRVVDPETGSLVFNTGTSKLQVYTGSAWVDV